MANRAPLLHDESVQDADRFHDNAAKVATSVIWTGAIAFLGWWATLIRLWQCSNEGSDDCTMTLVTTIGIAVAVGTFANWLIWRRREATTGDDDGSPPTQ